MKIFIGYENEYPESFEVCAESIRRFNPNHEIIPLIKSELEEKGLYTREYQGESTDFAFTRFLVPFLSDYKGYALFCDGDFMWRCDPQEIEDYAKQSNYSPSVWVVKHPPFLTTPYKKMKGKANMSYPKKYWSSLMYFNNDKCFSLTSDLVNSWSGKDLHEFAWASEIGDLPAEYNAMVNYYKFPNAKAVHFTDGGPWLDIHDDMLYSTEWLKIYKNLQKAKE
jgi:hypothetical protein|tara:strand:- start:3336 stop:4004 length:669 start_codon:yes stop_codon:yes gene_type:complete